MNEFDIQKMNEQITYEEGKIYWDHCKGYTSNLIKRLHDQGYVTIKSGAVYILRNPDEQEVVTGYSWEGLLLNVAKLFV